MTTHDIEYILERYGAEGYTVFTDGLGAVSITIDFIHARHLQLIEEGISQHKPLSVSVDIKIIGGVIHDYMV